MFEHLLYTNIIVPKTGELIVVEHMESFPPESAEHAAKKQRQESSHKRAAATVDEFPDDAKRQAAEIVYLERYE
jgi:hypothetical protein